MIFYGLAIGDDDSVIVPVGDAPLFIGRGAASADVLVNNACVSKQHCRLLLDGTELIAQDLNSRNGTFLNGEPIQRAVLKPGDRLRVAHIEFRIVKISDNLGGTHENADLIDAS